MVEEDGKVKTASHLHSKEETTADTTNRENDLRGCRTDHLPLGKKSRPLEYCKGGTVIDGAQALPLSKPTRRRERNRVQRR